MNQLSGKTALVTGGTSGIGLATAQRLAAEGAHVFITGRRQGGVDDAVASIGDDATGVQGDITDADDLERLAGAIQEHGEGWTSSSPTPAVESSPLWRMRRRSICWTR